ncbi:MAG TPA: SAM-dependent methyltransferase [Puia sp.]|nr:SAM-dependent methyltransferase [Puia sp.]
MQDPDTLRAIIRNSIQRKGPLTFRDFMEMALYHPDFGYYTSSQPKLGQAGDYYTSCYVTGLFGELLALQFEEMWLALDRRPFTIVEYGAGTGLLCRDILCRLQENTDLYEKLNYFIIEKSGAMRARERLHLPEKVEWKESIDEIAPVAGCIFSNELVDNFAVHRVTMTDQLMEICVGYDGDFVEILRPAPAVLQDYLIRMNVELPPGYRAEVNLEATRWIREIGRALRRGWVMTIDYGYPAAALYRKPSGTLACYRRHQAHFSPYEYIGEQDITAHVNFTALDYWGRMEGLAVSGYTSQTHFLQGLGLADRLRIREKNGITANDRAILNTFLLKMGPKFKVLIQHKGVEKVRLFGLVFSDLLR